MNSSINSTNIDIYSKFRLAAPDLVIVDRIITPVWYIIGIVGNTISAKIWLSKNMRKSNSSAIYLGSIAVVDLIFIFVHFWLELQGAWGISTYNKPVLCELFNVLLYFPQYLTPLLILAFTFERFIAICFPFLKETFCSVKKAVIGVCILTSFSVALGLPQAFFWTYSAGMCVSREQSSVVQFYKIWTWVTEMLIFAVVPIVVLVLNILVIREIKRITEFQSSFGNHDRSRSSNQTSTITLLSVSFYLICTLLPTTIVYAIQFSIPFGDPRLDALDWPSDPTWSGYLAYYHIRKIVEEICFSNYACYGVIYYVTSGYFREEVHKLWCCTKCSLCKTYEDESLNKTQYSIVVSDKKKETIPVNV